MWIFISLLTASASASVMLIILLVFRPILEVKLPTAGMYVLTIVIMLRLLIPYSPETEFFKSMAPINKETMSVNLVEWEYKSFEPTGNGLEWHDFSEGDTVESKSKNSEQLSPKESHVGIRLPYVKLLLILWATVASIKFLSNACLYISYRRRIVNSMELSESCMAILKNIADGRKYPPVYVSKNAVSPMLMGLIRPIIVVPAIKCTDTELQNILRHEYCHYRRGDILIKWLSAASLAMHWFNPMTVYLRRALNEYCELSCDERATQDMNSDERKSYIYTLIKLMENSVDNKRFKYMPWTAMSVNVKKINKRLERIMTVKKISWKKIVMSGTAVILAAAMGITLGSCGNNLAGNNIKPKNAAMASNLNQTARADYNLHDCKLISDNRLLMAYNTPDYIYQFRIYDLKTNKVICSSEELQLKKISPNMLHLLNDYFYYLYNGKYYVYDFSCKLVKIVDIPKGVLVEEEYGTFANCWLSNDLSRMLYVKNPDNTQDCIYISDTDGKNEEVVCDDSNSTSLTEAHFSSDDSKVGFYGCTIPDGKDESVDSYGCIDIRDKTMKVYKYDDANVNFYGDNMLILDNSPVNSKAKRKGKVRIFNYSTGKYTEIKTDVAIECEDAILGTNPNYLVTRRGNEKNLKVNFSIYEEGKKIFSAESICESEEEYNYLTSCNYFLDFNLGENFLESMFLFGWDIKDNKREICMLKYDNDKNMSAIIRL